MPWVLEREQGSREVTHRCCDSLYGVGVPVVSVFV